MLKLTDISQCSGCTACMAVCPRDAITMKPDVLGFKYPHVNEDLCVECGLCEAVCDFKRRGKIDDDGKDVKVFAARHCDDAVLRASQSGGLFSALSDVVLKEGGVIYGAVFDGNHMVEHARAEDTVGRDLMRGSKYIQSDLKDTFRNVLRDLRIGNRVMFVGTPCQVAGLKSFIPSALHEQLLLVDFICHGVPSPEVWKAYLAGLQKKHRIVKADFRDKAVEGWKVHKESFLYEDDHLKVRETFKVLFYKNIMLRHSCGACNYNVCNRASDIVMADFWGLSEIMPEMDGGPGTSMAICLTEKGKRYFEAASENLMIHGLEIPLSHLAKYNPNVLNRTRIHHERNAFEKAFAQKGFRYVAARWGDRGWRYKVWQLKCLFRKLKGKA